MAVISSKREASIRVGPVVISVSGQASSDLEDAILQRVLTKAKIVLATTSFADLAGVPQEMTPPTPCGCSGS